MNKQTLSHAGGLIAVVIILAIMVAFATPFGDYVADSSNQLISSFTGKSNASLCEANSRDYKFRPLLVSRIVSATNQSGDPLTYDALDMNSASLRSGLVAFTSGSVDELNVNNAQLVDVIVEDEYTSATISFDVSDLAREGDEIGVYHYNESTSSWEHIGNYIANSEREITATFASLSPVALINLTKDYTVVDDNIIINPHDPMPDPNAEDNSRDPTIVVINPQDPMPDPNAEDAPDVVIVDEDAPLGVLTDLTGTTWRINSTSCSAGYGQYAVELTVNGMVYSFPNNLYIGYRFAPQQQDVIPATNCAIIFPAITDLVVGDIIEFTGGADVTNPRLIAWVKESATQIQSQPNLITFYIETTECHAEAGMTWGEYVNSEYCTAEWEINTSIGAGSGGDSGNVMIKRVITDRGDVDPVAPSIIESSVLFWGSFDYLTYNGGTRSNDCVQSHEEIIPNHVYKVVAAGAMD